MVPIQGNCGADGAAVASRALQMKLNPPILGVYSVAIDQQRTALICHNDIKRPIIPQVGQGHSPSIIEVGSSNLLSHLGKVAGAITKPDALLFIAGEASPVHGRPVGRIRDNGAIGSCHLIKFVPVALVTFSRIEAVGKIEVEVAVVIEVAELRPKAPAP